MSKLELWTPGEAQRNLMQRLTDCFDNRRNIEYRWQQTERTIFATNGNASIDSMGYTLEGDGTVVATVSNNSETIGINYAAKNLRFIHAQMSANPPTVVPRPNTNDPEDRRRADAADRLVRFALREYELQETFDRATLNTLVYGNGFIKTVWNADGGEPLDVDEETGEILMEGEFQVSVPKVWDIFFDPDANCWEDVRYVFERVVMPYEEALFKFPGKKDVIQKYRKSYDTEDAMMQGNLTGSALRRRKYDIVELYQYWEKGMPYNGFLGRFCYCTGHGELITELMANPERFSAPRKDGKKPLEVARLPYHMLSDIDVPDTVWGKSTAEYNVGLQNNLNKIDAVALENLQAHGVGRILLPEGSEIADDSITNSPWDIIKFTGTQPPHYMAPMPIPEIIPQLMARWKTGIDDTSGINESMLGQQSRETSGFSMQYATNQGNMIRRRLFNKYVLFVESVYNAYLRIVQKHWDVPRTIKVLGKEKAFESMDIKGADILGGFDLVVEYGASLSLDPTARREEIITLMPLFKEAGVEPRQLLNMMKLNELAGMYDSLDLAADRQREIFEEMINTGLYQAPEDLMDHKNMLSFAYYYVMTTEFKYLTDGEKALIRQHIKAREQLAASQVAGAAGGPAAGAAPALGAPGSPGPMPSAPINPPNTQLPGSPVPPGQPGKPG